MSIIHNIKSNDYQRNVEKDWELFNCDIRLDNPKVSEVVFESWKRSRQYNIDASLNMAPAFSENKVVDNIHLELRNAALPIIKASREILDDNQLVMLLASAEGTIIEREGNARSLLQADSQQLIIDSNWAEHSIGTNALGTALSLNKPVQILAKEHYCEVVRIWGCAAVPIKDLRDGSVLGVLDTTGPENSFHSMNLGWVKSMASCIEFRLNEGKNKEKLQLIESCAVKVNRWGSEAVMVFDNDGFFIWNNQKAVSNNVKLPSVLNNISVGMKVSQLSLSSITANEFPEGINREFIETVSENGKVLGHIVIFPQALKNNNYQQNISRKNYIANDYKSHLIGNSESTIKQRELAKKLAKSKALVTICGETGTGKEIIAKEIHSLSGLTGNFISVNCGAITKDLLASELFGYADGSFSGAKRGGMIGKFEAAQDGTLLLDEFCEMPLDMQVYLLRVLEEREIVRVGESKPRQVNARIIVATNKVLEDQLEARNLREDLYYRISATVITLPPLRKHSEDIPVLFNHFIESISKESGDTSPQVTAPFMDILYKHDWPGNIRELRNFAENCFLMNPGEQLTENHIPQRMKKPNIYDISVDTASDSTLKEIEKKVIEDALSLFGGNISKAAQHLGIARSTFYKKIKSS